MKNLRSSRAESQSLQQHNRRNNIISFTSACSSSKQTQKSSFVSDSNGGNSKKTVGRRASSCRLIDSPIEESLLEEILDTQEQITDSSNYPPLNDDKTTVKKDNSYNSTNVTAVNFSNISAADASDHSFNLTNNSRLLHARYKPFIQK